MSPRALSLFAGALALAACRAEPPGPIAANAPAAAVARPDASPEGASSPVAAVAPISSAGSAADQAPRTAPPPQAPRTAPPPQAPSAAIILGAAAAIEPSGRVPLVAGSETVVDPGATFELELSSRSADARLVLLDGRDALVAATSAREVGAASTRLTLAPAAPLSPGSRYVLRLDGAVTRELHDADGRGYEPVAHHLLAAGTPPPPEPKKSPKRRRRR
jgi:hypothetical protein